MKARRRSKASSRRNGLILLVCFGLVAAVVLFAGWRHEQKNNVQQRGVSSQNVGELKRVEYNGETYVEKTALTSILLVGTDREDGTGGYGARQGGQADFLLLLVIDHGEKTIHQLQIDRDTITEVEMLGVLGNPIGTRPMQICLAHAFGTTSVENCGFIERAVENLLEGIEIDYCIALDMGAIGRLNDVLGGVTVTIDEDLTDVDPQMTKGAVLKLTGEQAQTLVRSRMQLGDGTNESRMRRQRWFLSGAVDALREKVGEDTGFFDELLDSLADDLTMTVQRSVLLGEANRAYAYETLPVETLDGEHTIGEDGFVEFHVAQGATAQWVMGTFYRPEK